MKSKIFMYLFFFVLLLLLFMYMNQKSIYESQEQKITSLTSEEKKQKDSIAVMNERIADLNYFTLQGNENAITYFESLGMDASKVEASVTDEIYDMNVLEGGNPLIPFKGDAGSMRVNKIKFINHRWIQADFSDGSSWGEMLVEYFFDENNELELTTLSSVLYPN